MKRDVRWNANDLNTTGQRNKRSNVFAADNMKQSKKEAYPLYQIHVGAYHRRIREQ
jgi:hypothetical protein